MPSLPKKVLATAVLSLSAIASTVLNAQPSGAPATVVIAAFENYPAFTPRLEQGKRVGHDLRAIVIPRDYADKSRSMVILNPAHATPEVLYAAIGALRSASQRSPENLIVVTRRGTPAASAVPRVVRSALKAAVDELLSAQSTRVRGHKRGKQIVLGAAVLQMLSDPGLQPSR